MYVRYGKDLWAGDGKLQTFFYSVCGASLVGSRLLAGRYVMLHWERYNIAHC